MSWRQNNVSLRIPDTKTTRASVYCDAGDARYDEAVYLEDKYPSTAIYLAGYVIECHLKWALCQRAGVSYLQDFPDRDLCNELTSGRGHHLERLCEVSGYEAHFRENDALRKAFRIAAAWSPNIRYIRDCGGRAEAARFMAAVRVLRADLAEWANK
jgi:hypothetical protein